jgi:hypothetical protein
MKKKRIRENPKAKGENDPELGKQAVSRRVDPRCHSTGIWRDQRKDTIP